ncbi:polyketide synthase [Fusarium circinatum]|uniref:Polyketide synthase n=1 Tax=Fusarium circinatum TaxID=48490 RepID=A0A8H5WNG3_FUSCI|nr:polyketide synthase [Fusarium circinatum]
MADNTPGPSAVAKAKATVRVKGKDSEYGKTLEFDTFQSLGGNPEDLMDEERWLDDPKEGSERNWTACPRAASCSDPTRQNYEEDWD